MVTEKIAGYVLSYEIGRGGFGIVYKATDRFGKTVAVKVLQNREDMSYDSIANLFLRQAEQVARLNHPNIVQVYDSGLDDSTGLAYSVSEYTPGHSLADLLKNGSLDCQKSVRITYDVLKGLGYAHDKGVLHLDIKPGNILLSQDGSAKLCDFGTLLVSEQIKGSSAPKTSHNKYMICTLEYMSPEHKTGKLLDCRSDIYQTGLVLYEMLTGQLPTPESTNQPKSRNPVVPKKLDYIVARSLKDHAFDRYQSARAMQDELSEANQPLTDDTDEITTQLKGITKELKRIASFREQQASAVNHIEGSRATVGDIRITINGNDVECKVGRSTVHPGNHRYNRKSRNRD